MSNINISYSSIKKARNEIADLYVSGNISESTFQVVSELIDLEISRIEAKEIVSEIKF